MADSVRPIIAVASARLRYNYRQTTDKAPLAALMGVIVVVLSWILILPGGEGAYHYGTMYAAGDVDSVSNTIRTTGVRIFVLILLMMVFRAANTVGELDKRQLFASINVSRRIHITGIILSECGLLGSILLVPAVAAAIAFGIGSASVIGGVSLFLGALPFVLVVPVVAYPIGFFIDYLIKRAPGGQMVSVLLGLGFMLTYFLLIIRSDSIVPLLVVTPLSLYGDVLMSLMPNVTVYTAGVSLIAVLPLVLFPVSVYASGWLADGVWYGPEANTPTATDPDNEETAISPLKETDTSRSITVAKLTIRQAIRSPYMLIFAIPGIVATAVAGYTTFTSPESANSLPLLFVFLGSVAAGSSFPLNPLGNDEIALPWLFTSFVTPEEYVKGKAIATVLVALPVLTVSSGIVAVLAGYSLLSLLILLGMATAASICIPFTAVGIGTLVPNFERTETIQAARTALPDRGAITLLFISVFVCWLPGGTGVLLIARSESMQITTMIAGVGGGLGSILIFAAAGWIGYRLAVQQISRDIVDGTGGGVRTRSDVIAAVGLDRRIGSIVICSSVLVAAFGMTTLFAAPLIAVFGQGIVESPLLQILITFGGYVTAAGLYIRLSKRGVQFLDIERPTRTEVVVALATFGAILIVQLIGTGLTPSGGTALGTNMNVESVMLLLAIIVSGAFFIPVAEELLFRNILQKILSKNISAQIAIVSVSLVFMLLHIGNYSLTTPVQAGIGLSSVFVQSIVLGLAYERTENILVPISAHAIYNLIAYSTLTASLVG